MINVAIVSPVFNEEKGLDAFFNQTVKVLESRPEKFRFTFVNDGSTDGSLAKLQEIQKRSPYPVKIIDLSRNFGHSHALTAGIFMTEADAMIIMDSDLEDPPSLIPKLLEEFHQGKDVVYTVKTRREESLLRKILFSLFHFCFSRITNLNVPEGSGSFSLMSRRFVEEFKKLGESNRFIPGLRSYVGFTPGHVYFERGRRFEGSSRQSLKRLSSLALNAFFLFSSAGLWMGAALFTLGVLLVSAFCALTSSPLKLEVTLLAILLLMILALQLVTMLMAHKTQEESLKRPLYIVRQIYERS